jgi:hypothetical protein
MPRITRNPLAIWGALLLTVSLVSCSSPASQPASGQPSGPPTISAPQQSQSPSPAGGKIEQDLPDSSEVPKATSSALPEEQPDSSTPAVEVSTLNQTPKDEEVLAPEPSFNTAYPSLAGISLGASEKDVVNRFGLPADTYDLPGEKLSIEIWEYEGFSIGLNADHSVVYIEIISDNVNTGFQGLRSGMSGSQAAQLLGVASDAQTNVLTLEVTGGWIKLDLDPDSHVVLSLKLLSKEI